MGGFQSRNKEKYTSFQSIENKILLINSTLKSFFKDRYCVLFLLRIRMKSTVSCCFLFTLGLHEMAFSKMIFFSGKESERLTLVSFS